MPVHGGRIVGSRHVIRRPVSFRRDAAAFGRRVRALAAEPAPVDLALAAQPRAGGLDVTLDLARHAVAATAAHPLAAYVALYENGLVSAVQGGENRGATLRHERVVRVWRGPFAVSANPRQRIGERIALPAGASAARTGVAAFVEDTVTGDVVQALDLPSCG